MIQRIKNFLFKNTSDKQIVAKNTFWLSLSEVLSRILKLILIVYAARILGADGWGTFSYALSLASLIMIFSDIGLGNLIAREAVQKKEQYRSFITAALFLKGCILLLSVVVVIVAGYSFSNIPQANILFPIIGVIFLFDSLRDLGFAINRATEKMEREMIVKVVMGIVILMSGFILLKLSPTPMSIATAYVSGSIIGCILIMVIIRTQLQHYLSPFNPFMMRTVLQTVWPLALITLISSIMGNIDIYMMGIWSTTTEIGLYSSVQRIQQFIIIIPSMIATASFPLMSLLAHTDKKQLGVILGKSIIIMLLAGIPIAVGGTLLSKEIIVLLFGIQYVGAAPVLQILMVMLLVSFPLIMLSNVVFVYDKQKNLALAYGIGVIANIILNTLLIPQFGAIGAALATLLSTTIITVVIWRKLQSIQPFSVFSQLRNIILSTAVIIALIFAMRSIDLPVVLTIIISMVTYIFVLAQMKDPLLSETKNLFMKKRIL